MKASAIFLKALVLIAVTAVSFGTSGLVSVTPLQKVLELLQGMVSQAKTSKHEEQVQYAAFKQFCDDVSVEKQKAVKEADETIETLEAHIQKFDSETERLGAEIVRHNADIAGWTNDSEAAAAVRDVERGDYNSMHRNYSESIHAVSQAISFLKAQAYDRPGSAAVLLDEQARLPLEGRRAITALLARSSEDPDDLTFNAAPQVPTDAYRFRSHDVISMLEKLKGTFKDKLAELEREEVARRHAHETLTQDLKQSVEGGKTSIETKTGYQAQYKLDSTNAAAELVDIKATRADDAAYLEELTATCTKKADDFASRQKLREEEIVALTKAVEILSGEVVTNVTEKHLPKAAALLRTSRSSLVQVRSPPGTTSSKQERIAALLLAASNRLGSTMLSTIAAQARTDPFAKVKQLIEELITRLLAQTGEEAEHKGWCDKELGTNEHTRKTKSDEVETLTAETDALDAGIAILKKNLDELQKSIEELDADMSKEVEMRNKEKAENEKTIEEAKKAQAAVVDAIAVLNKFYGKAADATAFVQGARSRANLKNVQPAGAPAIFDDTPYIGLHAESGGVLGMMEVIQADFARLEQDTATSEATAADEHAKFMEASRISKVQKEKDRDHKESEKQSKESELLDKQSNLEIAERELAAAQDSFEKLKPACLDTGMSYQERKQRREEEIEALKQALSILEEV